MHCTSPLFRFPTVDNIMNEQYIAESLIKYKHVEDHGNGNEKSDGCR